MTHTFAVSFDYRCPFARNAQEAVVTGVRAGRDWDVRFLAFSLDQVHVAEGEPPVWERPPGERGSGVARARVGHRGARHVPRPLPRRARRRCSRPATTTGAKLADVDVLREAVATSRRRRRRGCGRGRVGPAA